MKLQTNICQMWNLQIYLQSGDFVCKFAWLYDSVFLQTLQYSLRRLPSYWSWCWIEFRFYRIISSYCLHYMDDSSIETLLSSGKNVLPYSHVKSYHISRLSQWLCPSSIMDTINSLNITNYNHTTKNILDFEIVSIW